MPVNHLTLNPTNLLFLCLTLPITFNSFAKTTLSPPNYITVGLAEFPQVYNYEDGQFSGHYGKFLTCLFDMDFTQNTKFKFIFYPSPERIINALTLENIEIGFPVSQSNSRDKKAVFIGDTLKIDITLVSKKDLDGHQVIGYRSGTIVNKVLLGTKYENTPLIHVKSTKQLLEMFRLKRIDGFIESIVLVPNAIISDDKNTITTLASVGLGMYVSKKLNTLNSNLKSIIKNKSEDCQYLFKAAKKRNLSNNP